jgi:uncharacterized protein (DUF1778 family)
MTLDPPAGHRRRPYVFPGRQKRLSIRVTDNEYAEIASAADQFGFTPTGFCAHAALDAARSLSTGTAERMEHEALGNLQAELFQARVTLNQLNAALEHAHTTRASPRTIQTRRSPEPRTRWPTSTTPSPASAVGSALQDRPSLHRKSAHLPGAQVGPTPPNTGRLRVS